jgi:hypothetical protein
VKKAIQYFLVRVSENFFSTKYLVWASTDIMILAMYILYLVKSTDHTKAATVFGYLCLALVINGLIYSMHNVIQKVLLKVDPNLAINKMSAHRHSYIPEMPEGPESGNC